MKKSKKQWIPISLGLIIGVSISAIFFISASNDAGEDTLHQQRFNDNYRIYSLSTPNRVSFADEQVPLNLIDVREKLDRELLVNTYWQSNAILLHKRAHRWFPVIEPILKSKGIPDDFKYLALIESGFENVVSPAGATGFWQFLKGTATDYGLEINDEVDERYSVKRATEAACEYLIDNYRKYGSWPLVAAAYNMGQNGLERQMRRQHVNNYFDLLLNDETGRYVYRILALKVLLTNSEDYGFHIRTKDLYPTYKTYTVQVDSSVSDWGLFAQEFGVNYKILKTLNPWLRDSNLTNKRLKTYDIELPIESEISLEPFKKGEFDFERIYILDTRDN
ncbi:MAG: membrane-bound lytic murein transglycosylase D [Flavobacteriales bacterium]|jgi:membrane-bound lytic murein transglycosylase D